MVKDMTINVFIAGVMECMHTETGLQFMLYFKGVEGCSCAVIKSLTRQLG